MVRTLAPCGTAFTGTRRQGNVSSLRAAVRTPHVSPAAGPANIHAFCTSCSNRAEVHTLFMLTGRDMSRRRRPKTELIELIEKARREGCKARTK